NPKARLDEPAQRADFLGQQKSGSAAPKMELHRLPVRIQERSHQIQFLLQIFQIGRALPLLGGDDGRATTEPAKGLAKRQVKIEGEVSRTGVVAANVFQHELPGQLLAESR